MLGMHSLRKYYKSREIEKIILLHGYQVPKIIRSTFDSNIAHWENFTIFVLFYDLSQIRLMPFFSQKQFRFGPFYCHYWMSLHTR